MVSPELRVTPEQSRLVLERSAMLYDYLHQAVTGVSFAKMKGLRNEDAREANSRREMTFDLGTFDRRCDEQRRAERAFRTRFLPGTLELIAKEQDFTLDAAAIDRPNDFSVLAELHTEERNIQIMRLKLTAQEVDEVLLARFDPAKLDSSGTLPGEVMYRLNVANLGAVSTLAAQA